MFACVLIVYSQSIALTVAHPVPSFGMGVCDWLGAPVKVGFVEALRLKQSTIPNTICRSRTALFFLKKHVYILGL